MRRYSSTDKLAHALWYAVLAATYTFLLRDYPRAQLGLIAALTFYWVAVDRRARLEAKIKKPRLKEISCGYECSLDHTPGEFEGQKYDAIQRNVRAVAVSHIEEGEAVVYREDGKVEAAK